MKRKKICQHENCSEPPHLGGLCEVHAAEARFKSKRQDDAVRALHHCAIDDAFPLDPLVKDELLRISVWWRDACDSLNYQREHAVLRDEADAATSWCIALAQELVDAERAYRAGNDYERTLLDATSQWVWERFRNLERGLKSNGVVRPKQGNVR